MRLSLIVEEVDTYGNFKLSYNNDFSKIILCYVGDE